MRLAASAAGHGRAEVPFLMPSVTMPTFWTPAPLAAFDHVDDVAVAQRAIADDEHRLVAALLVDRAQLFFELRRS
jgi:hypothetical protein